MSYTKVLYKLLRMKLDMKFNKFHSYVTIKLLWQFFFWTTTFIQKKTNRTNKTLAGRRNKILRVTKPIKPVYASAQGTPIPEPVVNITLDSICRYKRVKANVIKQRLVSPDPNSPHIRNLHHPLDRQPPVLMVHKIVIVEKLLKTITVWRKHVPPAVHNPSNLLRFLTPAEKVIPIFRKS